MAVSPDVYLEQLTALLPPGSAWSSEPGSERRAVLAAVSQELARIGGRAEDLLRELHPATAVELLPEWEALYDVSVIAGATLQQRQAIVAWYHRYGGDVKKPHLEALAGLLGYTIRIDNYLPPIIGYFAIGDMLVFEQWQEFTAGVGAAGDHLGQEASPAILPACWLVVVLDLPAVLPAPTLEEILADIRPAHIHLNFIYP